MKQRYTFLFRAGVFMAAAVLVVRGHAQPGRRLESPANRSLVTVVRVKPEMLNEWIGLQKNAVVPLLKRLGVSTRTVYGGGVFGDAFEYTIIQPMNKFADFDSADMRAETLGSVPEARLAEKLRKCLAGSSIFLSTALPDLSNPGETPHPPIVQFPAASCGARQAGRI